MTDAQRSPAERLLALVARLTEHRKPPSPRTERILLTLAALLFVAASLVAWRTLPPARGPVRWWPLVLATLAGVPGTILMNAAEYEASGRILRHRIPPLDALRVSVLSTAANLLPIPGSVLVRTRALRRLGSTVGRAVASTASVGLAWMATTGVLAGALVAGEAPAFGWVLLACGVAGLGLAYLVVRAQSGPDAPGLLARVVAIETGSVAVGAARMYLVLQGLGFDVSPAQAAALTVANVAASAPHILPGGLGIRELVAAGIGPLVDLDASAALLASSVDRLIGLLLLAPVSIALVIRKPTGAPPAEEPV